MNLFPDKLKLFYYILILLVTFSCTKAKDKTSTLFKIKSTHINFENTLVETEELNPYTYKNFYNGGGVALGDINNDGLLDIYFTGNLVNNQLYLNKGNWLFENITEKAGVACDNVWSSGVTFVDINHDGLLDIYVCKAGPPSNQSNRHNELFINNGDLTFSEQSKKYGLDIVGLSVQANFFDYDKDGDLDCYLLSNSIRAVGNYDLIKDQRNKPTTTGNKFLRNNNGFFVDITQEANIYSSAIGFGLGITVSDYNNDSWPDIFISNDFFERDYFYVNQQDGTFKDHLENQFESISMGSMGADAADLNNDSRIDIMVTEMLPKTLERQRTKTLFESWNKYDMEVKNGYHYQFSRNALHRNMGDDTFFEVSRFSNVAASEWSWASLLFDADNDGLKDIFVSNGIAKDLLDRDYLVYMANEDQIRDMIKNDKQVMKKLINLMPSQPVPNVAFKNHGNFEFTDESINWGLDTPSFSNGSAYGDLDNDGDLDLVVNNVNMLAFIYENQSDTTLQSSITLKLKGDFQNTFAIGAKAEIYFDNSYSILENFPSRGFQSSVSPDLLFGTGASKTVDSLIISWPNGTKSKHQNLKTNQVYNYTQPSLDTLIKQNFGNQNSNNPLQLTDKLINFKHNENNAVDFNREQLLPEMFNNEGPNIASEDINNDGNPDFYIGGAKGYSGSLFLSQPDKSYKEIKAPFELNSKSEDTDAIFFDSDNDGDLDLYVCSGGKSFSKFDFSLNDRLYINDGNSNFSLSSNALPFKSPISSSTVSVYDFDQDGDVDIFIGERFQVETYGIPTSGYILENKGGNKFEFSKQQSLSNIGLITDSQWADLNNDGVKDLIVVGEWMPVSIFINKKGVLTNETKSFGLENTSGYWKTLKLVDVNKDGSLDILAGNKGTNSFFNEGIRMYVSDFDNNGTVEQIICYKRGNNYYPILDRDELISQIASLKQKLLFYKDFSNATIQTIFSKEQLDKAIILDINTTKTTLFINKNNTFKAQDLPVEIQYSNVEAIVVFDVNSDGNLDVIFGGNQYLVKPQFGRQDASRGWLLYGDDKHQFNNVIPLNIKGQIRDFNIGKINDRNYLLTTINNDSLKVYEIK
ncbi:VCBS repeat-containing protein [Sabulilitoribacter multivorans]|uniref:VCBS repeat-containing protein n=1 Tax=Flaviramulus multivorans TaxID=1304750 RepID=A0ABS9II80_9FLAO|nr:VCBS repeat-containing protein [Flaviramulus multivorans]MCF7560471.1 VCBS repeat-containing protein [Flaviramulus multivorans]